MLELAERSYAGTVPLGVSLSLAVVLIGGVWIYFSTARGRKQRLSPDPTAAPRRRGESLKNIVRRRQPRRQPFRSR